MLELEQEGRAVAGNPRDAAINFDMECLGTVDRSTLASAA